MNRHAIANRIVIVSILSFLILNVRCSTTFYLAPKQVECSGASDQKCYLVRKSAEGNWVLHDEEIVGFNYEPGFSYRLRIKKERIQNPTIGNTLYRYELIEVLEKRDVTEDLTLEDLVDKEWEMEYFRLDGISYGFEGKIPTMKFFDDGRIGGNDGCNNYFGIFKVNGRTINIGDVGSTKMFCQERQELEQAFLKALSLELRGLFSDNKLVLSADGGHQMIFHIK